jgi:uncharacterized protein (DUF2236 family)
MTPQDAVLRTTQIRSLAMASLLGEQSLVRQRAGDIRLLLGASGYVLILQVAHPTVAAGVRDHSKFRADPWGRLLRTLDYAYLLAYSSREAATQVSTILRKMHRPMSGTDSEGRPYNALEPSAYAWVHATLGEGVVRGHERVGRPFDEAQRQQFWDEWLTVGGILGLGDGDLPARWSDFEDYFETMVDEVLEDNDVVQDVLATTRRPSGPSPFRWLDRRLLTAMARPFGPYGHLMTVGMMPPSLRDKLGLHWSPRQDRTFHALAVGHRVATPLMPPPLRRLGPTYLRVRRSAIAQGPFASALPTRH